MMNVAMLSTFTLIDLLIPDGTRISELPPAVALTFGQKLGPDRMLGPTRFTPVTSMSLRQFSAVSWVHLWPSTHQSQGKGEETHSVHEEKVLQSKKVKLVDTKSGPSRMRTDNFEVKWCSVGGMRGSKSFLGVVQLTPLAVLVALVMRFLPKAWKTHKNWPGRVGKLSITNERVRAVVL